jgi:hypothetical protein
MATTLLLLALTVPQAPAPAPATASLAQASLPGELPPDFLLLPASAATSVLALGPGTGGVPAAPFKNSLTASEGTCTTPGGVRVRAQSQGVLLEFPNGRELLFAPDGYLHLRSSEAAGPFPAGAELWLADGTRIGIVRTGSRRNELQEVTVAGSGARTRLWHRNHAVMEDARDSNWGGVRLLCCGEGDSVYRAVALGPLIALDRVLCPRRSERDLPAHRLVLLAEPLLQSLKTLPDEVGKVDPLIAQAVDSVIALNQTAAAVFSVAGKPPRRIGEDGLRYALGQGYELSFSARGNGPLRVALHEGMAPDPFVEWSVSYISELHLMHPERAGGKTSRYWGRAVPMVQAEPALRARQQLYELGCAEKVVQALSR